MWRRSIYRLYTHTTSKQANITNKRTNKLWVALALCTLKYTESNGTHSSSSCRRLMFRTECVCVCVWISLSYCWCSGCCCCCCCFSSTLFAIAGRYFVWFLLCDWRRRRPKWMGNDRKANKNEAAKTIKPCAHTLLLALRQSDLSSAVWSQWDSFATITTHLFDRATIHVDWYTSDSIK